MNAAGEIPSRLATAMADRYRIERELGAGGMATVYLAQDLVLAVHVLGDSRSVGRKHPAPACCACGVE